jgi:hypothetical protein
MPALSHRAVEAETAARQYRATVCCAIQAGSSMTNNFAGRAALQGTTNPRVSVAVAESNECPHVSA